MNALSSVPVVASVSKEDYLKQTLTLLIVAERAGDKNPRVKTGVLAQKLNVTPASATGMMRRLTEQGLMTHEPYRGATLTAHGRKTAMSLLRKHRLVELLLVRILGYRWDEVHDEAEKLEHAISDKLADRINAHLGNPTHDPHGDPIPSKSGKISNSKLVTAQYLPVGAHGVIRRVDDIGSNFLKYCASLNLLPGVRLCVAARAPYGDVTTFVVNGVNINVGDGVADKIYVEKVR